MKADVYDLQRNHKPRGFNLHRVGDADTGCWSVRVSRDRVRRASRDAYAWAEGRRLEVHHSTGAAQIVV